MDKIYTVTRHILSDTNFGGNPRRVLYSPQDVMEWAGRVCYKRTGQFGTNPDYLFKIIEREHFDVLEHGYYGGLFDVEPEIDINSFYYFAYTVNRKHPFLRVDLHPAERKIGLYGNMRVWRDIYLDNFVDIWGLFSSTDMQEMILTLNNLAPSVFPRPLWLNSQDANNAIGGRIRLEYSNLSIGLRGYDTFITPSGANVTLLAKTPKVDFTGRYHATFQLNRVSRALTHQLVRHRLFSFSQESQRYVDGSNFGFIMPDVLPEHELLIRTVVDTASSVYRELRKSEDEDPKTGKKARVLKEDARCVLLNGTTTNIVMSGEKEAYEHFVKLRSAPDAQKEIRDVAMVIGKILEEDNA